MSTLWRTFTSCMNCDKSVRPDATVCPHCGVTFGTPVDEDQGVLTGLPPIPVPQDTGDEHADFHQRSMLPMGSSLCATCAPVPSREPIGGYRARLGPRLFKVGDRVSFTHPPSVTRHRRVVLGTVIETEGSMCDSDGNASWLTTIQPDDGGIPIVGAETSMEPVL